MSGTPEHPKTFSWINPKTNLVEILDIHTGRVLCVQHSAEDLLKEKWDRLTRIDTPEGPVFIEKGINFDITKILKSTPYSQVLSDLICQKVAEGQTLLAACKALNLEYATICRWRRDSKEFREKLVEARKDRAEAFHDEMIARGNGGSGEALSDDSRLRGYPPQSTLFCPSRLRFAQSTMCGGGWIGAVVPAIVTHCP